MTNLIKLPYKGLLYLANSPKTLMLSYLVMLAGAGSLYSFFENKAFGHSAWWAVVTASTVGYGDMYPATWQGKVLAGLLISTMVLLVLPLITAHFASKLIVDADAFNHEEQEEIKQNLREIKILLSRDAGHSSLPKRWRPVRVLRTVNSDERVRP